MSLLDRELMRDILALRGQVVTIALVVAAGVAVFIASISNYDSLLSGRDRFYDSTRFPQIFVSSSARRFRLCRSWWRSRVSRWSSPALCAT